MSGSFNIKEKQKESLLKLLNFNKPLDTKESWEEPWKILIYDSFCRDIISPLLRVGELRKQGVTLHLLLDSDREPVPDVPAIYFVQPTPANLKRIAADCAARLYDSFHLNFASSLPAPLLAQLARDCLESDSVSSITRVYDQFLNFVALEKDLFMCLQPNSYLTFNDPTLSDERAEANVAAVVDQLFGVLVTLGVVPVLRCSRNGAAELVGKALDLKLSTHLAEGDHLFSNAASFQRPVLILLDRHADLSVPLHHPWTYQALVHDLLGLQLNRVKVDPEGDEGPRVYDLDSSDSFWRDNVGTPFPNIAVAVNSSLKAYKEALDEFTALSGGVGVEEVAEEQLEGRTRELGSFVASIPSLREQKRLIDVHTNLATALLSRIKARELDSFFSFEEGLLTRSSQDKKEILALLGDPKRGTPEDKMRLFLIYYLSQELSPADEKAMEEALQRSNVDLAPFRYIKKTKAFHESIAATLSTTTGSAPSGSSSGIRSLLQKANENVAESFGLGGGLSQQLGTLFSAGVKALLPSSKELYVTRIVDAIMSLKSDLGVDNFAYFDPKVQSKLRQGSTIPRKTSPFREAIVFVVGGGNYVEYQNLQEYALKSPAKKILYGSTEMVTPTDFLRQLSTLSSKM